MQSASPVSPWCPHALHLRPCATCRATLFPDVALASKLDCCAAFFCVPLANSESDPQPSEPADFPTIARIGALLLGFSTQTDVTEE